MNGMRREENKGTGMRQFGLDLDMLTGSGRTLRSLNRGHARDSFVEGVKCLGVPRSRGFGVGDFGQTLSRRRHYCIDTDYTRTSRFEVNVKVEKDEVKIR